MVSSGDPDLDGDDVSSAIRNQVWWPQSSFVAFADVSLVFDGISGRLVPRNGGLLVFIGILGV